MHIATVSTVTVSTTKGRVRGYTDAFLHKQVEVFLGVPYAKPPVGELRFGKPQLPDSWDGIYEATSVKDSCMQARVPWVFHIPTPLSEDCLYLNVWTPNATQGTNLPVLVWFYGGIFKIGSAYETRYNAIALSALNDVVVVSCNFRLSIFGYLDAETIPGNVGLWDQLLVLQWVQENILSFGGDPNLVTAFGQSSGAMAIHDILVSPYSSGLFRRIFLMSGTQNTDTDIDSVCQSTSKGNAAAKALGCADIFKDLENHPEVVIDCLKERSAAEVSEASENVTAPKLLAFLPTFATKFLPLLPSVAIEEGQFRPVDALVSVAANEGAFAYVMQPDRELLWGDLRDYDQSELKDTLYNDILSSWLKDSVLPLAEMYLNVASPADNAQLRQAVADVIGNHYFYCPSRFFAEMHTAAGGNVYPFVFGHRSKKSDLPEWVRNTHMDDVPYVLGIPFVEQGNYTEEDREFSAFMMRTVVSFAREGFVHIIIIVMVIIAAICQPMSPAVQEPVPWATPRARTHYKCNETASLMGNVIKSMSGSSTPTAVLYSPVDAQLVTDFLRTSPVPVSVWTLLNDTEFRSDFEAHIAPPIYIPSRAFVLLPNHENLPAAVFREVARFEKYHSNVYWIFAVRKHDDIIKKLSNHSCQVITVSEVEVNEHFGDYKQCTRNHRRVLHRGQKLSLFTSTSSTKYPKHTRIEYAVFDRQNNFGGGLYGPKPRMVIEAYEALNNTLIQRWSTDDSDSMLLDRRVDVVLGTRNVYCWSRCFFYPYALYAPFSTCTLAKRAGPLVPSFASTWESFFCIPLVLAPMVVMILLVAHIQRRFSPNDASSLSGVIVFLVSTYLGRSPPPVIRSAAISSKLMMTTWMLGMLFLINFIQTEITSSRAVPEYSSAVRNMADFLERIQSNATGICVNAGTSKMIRKVTKAASTISYLHLLNRVLEQCGQGCTTDSFWRDCAPKIRRGTHVGVILTTPFLLGLAEYNELVPGADSLFNFIIFSPAHGSFPLR
ncbi:hypothetical protein HPB50_013170 [Hyalomma asiaticum]|uniref:Uncharacterized protein n=1 Tax=Hyalomma asiaticum TaxID=266040 RepID=A0ACB7S6N1_HYAAI|nr:hypothetical protein HPB50_013170 [Hyalomma asiaticum]